MLASGDVAETTAFLQQGAACFENRPPAPLLGTTGWLYQHLVVCRVVCLMGMVSMSRRTGPACVAASGSATVVLGVLKPKPLLQSSHTNKRLP